MTHRIFLFIVLFFVVNSSKAQLALTEGLKLLVPNTGAEALNLENIEEITNKTDMQKGQLSVVKYDNQGRKIQEIKKEEATNEPFKKFFWTYLPQKEIKITLTNTYEKWDTTKIETTFYQDEKVVKTEKIKINRYKMNMGGTSEIKRKEHYTEEIYEYDEFGELLTKTRTAGFKTGVKESNIYGYNDKNQVVLKKSKSSFLGTEILNDFTFQYDDLGQLTRKTILEDSIRVIYYYESGKKIKSEYLESGELSFESFFNHQENLTKVIAYENKELLETIFYDYVLDDHGNWIEIIMYTDNDRDKSSKIYRTIKYRD